MTCNIDMDGVEQGNIKNEEFIEEVARYECVYHGNSEDFKDKNKKANCWKEIGEKFNLSVAEAEVLKKVLKLTMTSLKGLTEEINLLAAKFPPRLPPCCLLRSSRQHNARVILTLLLTENICNSRLCDRCDYMETTPFTIVCDRLRSSLHFGTF